jgi:hypothetical protein
MLKPIHGLPSPSWLRLFGRKADSQREVGAVAG